MTAQPETSRSPMPLFYHQPEPLSSITHAAWRLKGGDLSFAAETQAIPVVVAEFARVARWYPIVFTAGIASPVALVGLERQNLFISGGAWDPQAYIPAYVRRYPFGFVRADEDRFALAIDAASPNIARYGDEGQPLFVDGKPTALTREALQFCDAFHDEAAATTAFCQAISEQELLVDRQADATLPDGRKFSINGFGIVDPEKFSNLPDAVVIDWHRKGWLGLVHRHLASLERFSALLELQGGREAIPASEAVIATTSDTGKPVKSKPVVTKPENV